MTRRGKFVALTGAAVGLGAGLAAQRSAVNRRRRNDPEGAETFGRRRGLRPRNMQRPDGASIYVEEAGPESRRGAVFVHGSALRTDLWHYQLEGLGDHRLVFYDLRGHGRSRPKGEIPFSVSACVDDLAAVIDEAGLDEVVLVGHSVGGMIALQLCRDLPGWMDDRIKGLVLAGSTYMPATETTAAGAGIARLERVVRRPLEVVRSRSTYLDSLRRIIKPSDSLFLAVAMLGFGPHASAKQVDLVYDMLADTPSDVILELVGSYRDFDMRGSLGDIRVPTLVISGTNDRITVHRASETLATQLPKAELRVFERCGHMPMLERHREFNTMLTEFLDERLGGGDGKPASSRGRLRRDAQG